MTQTDLAKLLKKKGLPFHQQTIQRIENGERPVRLNESFFIAESLGMGIWEMIYSVISEADEIAISMQNMSSLGTEIAENLSDISIQFNEAVESFGNELWPLMRRVIELTPEGQPVKDQAMRFHDLPYHVRLGLAMAVNLRDMMLATEKLFFRFAVFFGDKQAERSPDKWYFEPIPTEMYGDISAWVYELDCPELRELAKQHAGRLWIEAHKYAAEIRPEEAAGDAEGHRR